MPAENSYELYAALKKIEHNEGNRKAAPARRHPLLLIELLIACAVLFLVGGVIAVTATSFLRQQRFLNDVDGIKKTLELACTLAVISDIDFLVTFTPKEEEGWSYRLTTEELLPAHYRQLFDGERNAQTIGMVQWNGNHATVNSRGAITLSVRARGSVMSRGTLSLVEKGNGLSRYLCLESTGVPVLFTQLSDCRKRIDDHRIFRAQLSAWISARLPQDPSRERL